MKFIPIALFSSQTLLRYRLLLSSSLRLSHWLDKSADELLESLRAVIMQDSGLLILSGSGKMMDLSNTAISCVCGFDVMFPSLKVLFRCSSAMLFRKVVIFRFSSGLMHLVSWSGLTEGMFVLLLISIFLSWLIRAAGSVEFLSSTPVSSVSIRIPFSEVVSAFSWFDGSPRLLRRIRIIVFVGGFSSDSQF